MINTVARWILEECTLQSGCLSSHNCRFLIEGHLSGARIIPVDRWYTVTDWSEASRRELDAVLLEDSAFGISPGSSLEQLFISFIDSWKLHIG